MVSLENLPLPLHQRKLYGDQLRSENILLENINEEAPTNNNTILELDENEEKENCSNQHADVDDEAFYAQNNDSIFNVQKRQKKCCTKYNCLKCCRHFTAFMISRVGFLFLMIGYVLAGGLIFQELESEFENLSMMKGEQNINNMVNKIYKRVTENSIEIHDDSFGEFLKIEIENFRDYVKKAAMNGTLISGHTKQWNFLGAIFYTVTLLSTIGYGHITCKTRNGKIFTIVYSAIGVPLFLLFVANTGSSTAAVFKFVYIKFDLIRRRCKMSAYERQQLRHFDFENDRYLEFSQSDFDRGDDIISSSSIQDLKKEMKKRKKFLIKKDKTSKSQNSESNNKLSKNLKKANENQLKLDENNLYSNDNNVAKFNLNLYENEVFDSMSYAQHVQGKFSDTKSILADLELALPKSLNANQEKTSSSSLLSEKKTISLLETSNNTKFDGKIGNVMKRIDDLISTETIVQPLVLLENLTSDDRQSNHKIFSIIEQQNYFETEKTDDVEDEPKINITVNPIDLNDQPNIDVSKFIEQKKPEKKSKSFFKAFSLRNKKNRNKDETSKKSNESIHSNKDDSIKKSDSNFKKVQSESKFSKKKHETEPKIQINQNFVDPNADVPEYSENDFDSKSRRNSLFSRNKAVSLKSSPKKTDTIPPDEDRRKSDETLSNKNLIPLENNNFLKPTSAISKSLSSSTNSMSQANLLLKKDESNKSTNLKHNKHVLGRKLSYQLSTTSDRNSRRSPSVSHFPFTRNQWQFIYHDFHQRHQEKVGVPILLTIIIMPLYFAAGTILFSEFENWDKLDAFYFSFVTLTTIGFGDFIPGSSLSIHASELHMSISALYILIGLILVFTCINLMKQEFKNKIKSIARRFGL